MLQGGWYRKADGSKLGDMIEDVFLWDTRLKVQAPQTKRVGKGPKGKGEVRLSKFLAMFDDVRLEKETVRRKTEKVWIFLGC